MPQLFYPPPTPTSQKNPPLLTQGDWWTSFTNIQTLIINTVGGRDRGKHLREKSH